MSLEGDLRALRAEWPATPDLAAAVAPRLGERPARRRLRSRSRRRTLVLAFAALLALAGIAYAASPGVRRAVRDLLGIHGAEVRRVTRLPRTHGAGDPLLGRRVTLAQARRGVAFPVLVPGFPAAVFLSSEPAGGRVSFRGRGLVVSEFRGTVTPIFIRKFADAATRIRSVRVNGGTGLWIAGHPHVVVLLDSRGRPRQETLRLAQNTLLWNQRGLALRLEGAPNLPAALRIAASVR